MQAGTINGVEVLMKRFLKIFAIVIATMAAVIIGAIASIPLWLPAESLKAMIIKNISSGIGREVEIGSLKYDIIRGIEIKDVTISEPDGKTSFIRDANMELSYNLFALLGGSLVINKLELDSPYCKIIRVKGGQFNISDMMGKSAAAPEPGRMNKAFLKNIIVTGVYVKNGRIIYDDNSKVKAEETAIDDINLSIEDIVISAVKPVSVKMDCTVSYGRNKYPLSLRSKIKADVAAMSAEIEIERFSAAGTVSNGKISVKSSGDINGNLETTADTAHYNKGMTAKIISSVKLVGKKLAFSSSMHAYGGDAALVVSADLGKESYVMDASVKNVNIHDLAQELAAFMPQNKTADKTILDEIREKVYGTLDLNASFSGKTFDDMSHTIKGGGYFGVTNGKLMALDAAKNIGAALQVDTLKNDIVFDILSAHFLVSGGRISTNDLKMQSGPDGKSGDIKLSGAGYTTVDGPVDFKLQMDFNPRVAKNIGQSFIRLFGINDAGYAFNSDGWLPIDAKIYNTVKDQKYDLKQSRMMENIKRNLGKKLREGGLEDAAKKLLKGIFD
jgi:uncharacterized protein involved in outer membrane biogenesis